jgi:hypothetical protein
VEIEEILSPAPCGGCGPEIRVVWFPGDAGPKAIVYDDTPSDPGLRRWPETEDQIRERARLALQVLGWSAAFAPGSKLVRLAVPHERVLDAACEAAGLWTNPDAWDERPGDWGQEWYPWLETWSAWCPENLPFELLEREFRTAVAHIWVDMALDDGSEAASRAKEYADRGIVSMAAAWADHALNPLGDRARFDAVRETFDISRLAPQGGCSREEDGGGHDPVGDR